jgi:hypothetical protein
MDAEWTRSEVSGIPFGWNGPYPRGFVGALAGWSLLPAAVVGGCAIAACAALSVLPPEA